MPTESLTRAVNFFIPGLLVSLRQMLASLLTANAVVREKEGGTLGQLFVTPVRLAALMGGKVAPYLCLSFVVFLTIAALMRFVFQVTVAGSFLLLLLINVPFVLAALGVGLVVSAGSQTR